jgi:AraC family transcriptional regulator
VDQVEIIEQAIERIERDLLGPITVSEIASSSALSPWHFQRVFRALVGDSVGGYSRKRRLSRSIESLLETDARIIDIALQSGFESQEAYTRAFSGVFGLPPVKLQIQPDILSS